MPLDPSIYGQIQQPQQVNPLAQLAQVSQIQGAQQQNRLAALQMQEYERARQQDESQRAAVAGFGADQTQNYNALLRSGNLKGAQDYQKSQADLGKTNAESRAKQLETASKQIDIAGQAFGYVLQNPNTQTANSAIDYLAQNGVWTPEQSQQYKVQVANATPDQIRALAEQASRAALSAKDQLAKFQTNNLGATTVTQAIDPVTGQARVVSSQQNTQSPDNAASVSASLANAAATRAAAQTTAQGVRDAARIQTNFGNEQGLRKEFEGLAEVKNYKQALPAYQAVKDAAARNTPQADINLVYGIAKLYDPNSVVREGEYATVANSPNIPERVKGYAQYLAGGGKLSPETKKQILAEAEGRLQSYQGEVTKARDTYSNIAKQAGIRPEQVLQGTGEFQQGVTNPTPRPASNNGWSVKEVR